MDASRESDGVVDCNEGSPGAVPGFEVARETFI
jgi:hypothetical protein